MRAKRPGFTIVEIMIYITLVTVAMVVMAKFVADVTVNAARSKVVKEVQLNAQITLGRILNEIRNSQSVVSVGATQLVLQANATDQVTISYNSVDSRVERLVNGAGMVILTSPEVRVTNLAFAAISIGVSVSLSVAQLSASAPGTYQHQAQLSGTAFPRQLVY